MTNIDKDKIDLVKVIRSILGISDDKLEVFPQAPIKAKRYESKCHCRTNSPDTCEYCTDMETGEKFTDQDEPSQS